MKHLLLLILMAVPSPHLFPNKILQGWNAGYIETSSQGIAMIKQFEAFRAYPYKDSNGIRTIGYGHAITSVENKRINYVTKREAEELLRGDVTSAEQCIHQLISFSLTQNQFDALVSFVFNIGCPNFRNSHVYLYLKGKDFKNAVLYWKKWAYGNNGMLLGGLVRRRSQEVQLFNI